jgi:hypothetical protein
MTHATAIADAATDKPISTHMLSSPCRSEERSEGYRQQWGPVLMGCSSELLHAGEDTRWAVPCLKSFQRKMHSLRCERGKDNR